MRKLFVDTFFPAALLNPRDQWHARAKGVERGLGAVHLVTSELVLVELLNFFAEYPPPMRRIAARYVSLMMDELNVEVVEHTRAALRLGIDFYEARLDKEYSLTDCVSMNICREQQITDVLTHDNHFRQEGFNILL